MTFLYRFGHYWIAYAFFSPWVITKLVADSPVANFSATLPQLNLLEKNEAKARIAGDVRYLSSDEMRGRGPGSGGLDRAADLIADRWRELALNTKLFDGSPFQTFTIPGTVEATRPENNRLHWRLNSQESRECKLDRDFRPLALGSSGLFEGRIAFAGYGITADENQFHYDDYAEINVRGKIVIIIRKEPRQADPESPFDGTKSSRHAHFATKLSNAIEHGATGLIFVNDAISFEKNNLGQNGALETLPSIEDAGRSNNAAASIPTLFVTRQQVDDWLERVRPSMTLTQLERGIDDDLKPRSFEFDNISVKGEVLLEKNPLQIKNVIASMDGRGRLANETVVIGAHYDHVGMGGQGSLAPGTIEVHNGADDNASGTAALLEISRRFSEPRLSEQNSDRTDSCRRLVFIAFTGEERGLLGSRHYVAHPRFAIESTVAMINLDMVGRMTEDQLIVFGTGSSPAFDSILDSANRGVGLRLRKQLEAMGPSDHQPFFDQKVPVLHFFTGLHNDYHRPSDDFEKINTEGMVSITDIVYRIGSELTQRPERLEYIKVKGRANIRIKIEPRSNSNPK